MLKVALRIAFLAAAPIDVSVAYGDTLTILDSFNEQHRMRLCGIHAPEKKRPFGSRSRQNLAALALAKYAVVEWTKPDRYGRIIGKVIVDGRDVGLQQVQAGLAWWYRQYAREQSPQDRATYARAEEVARTARAGLWSDAEAVPPWEYRHPSARVQRLDIIFRLPPFLDRSQPRLHPTRDARKSAYSALRKLQYPNPVRR
jgi:endonuclease YncB( thermonuclease family)